MGKGKACSAMFLVVLVIGIIGLATVHGENIVVLNGTAPALTDPATAQDWFDTQAVYNIYSPLVHVTPEGFIGAHLAASWEAVGDDIGHWRFTLKEGIKFHDGSELTAEDVAFSMNRVVTMGKGYAGMIGKVKTEVVDDYVVDFFPEVPNSVFPSIMTLFWPVNKEQVLENLGPGDFGEMGDYGEDWLMHNDAGCGPYTLVEHDVGTRVVLEKFDDYFLGWEEWGANLVPVDKVVFIHEVEQATLIAMLNSDQLTLEANGFLSVTAMNDIIASPDLHIVKAWPIVMTLHMNTTKPPTDDVHFRRAIQYAFDYEGITARYEPFGSVEAGVIPVGIPGWVPIPPQPKERDLARAREELALSKYAAAETNILAHYCGGLQPELECDLQLQADLAKIGIDVEVVGPPWPQYVSGLELPETTPNMTNMIYNSPYPSPDALLFFGYHPSNLGGNWAPHWFASEEIGRLIELARLTLDEQDRNVIYGQLQELIAYEALAVFAYEIPITWTRQDYLIGPRNLYPMTGPNLNMHNWRIDLSKK